MNKTNHPISSNSQPSSTANKAIHNLKRGGGPKQTAIITCAMHRAFLPIIAHYEANFEKAVNHWRL